MSFCHVDITKVSVVEDYTLHLQFDDGTQGTVDIANLVPFEGVFEPLSNPDFFNGVHVNSDIGTICWDNGADLSPTYLHEHLTEEK